MKTEKEKLYQRAVKNLLQKVRWHQQFELLLTNQITEKEFDEEISKNSKKYVVDCTHHFNDEQILIIGEILKDINELNDNMGKDDVEEIFGGHLDGF